MRAIGKNIFVHASDDVLAVINQTGINLEGNSVNINNLLVVSGSNEEGIFEGNRVIAAVVGLNKHNVITFEGINYLRVPVQYIQAVSDSSEMTTTDVAIIDTFRNA